MRARSWRWKAPRIGLPHVTCLMVGIEGTAASSEWRQVGLSMTSRKAHAMAYDSARGRVVLFGGQSGSGRLADTREYSPPPENVCDGLDDDGNGLVDEECGDDTDDYCDASMTVIGSPSVCRRGGGDCDDGNAGAIAVPVAVSGLGVTDISGGCQFTWADQAPAAGSSTVYDVFSGTVSGLQPGGDFSTGSCRPDSQAAVSFEYVGPWPAFGDALYFMIRGQNTRPNGTGTYGNANRDTTAGQGASPCH